jgi:hypothetical protein
MTAFVGYVNSLVIEIEILQELKNSILSPKSIRNADQVFINEIAAEDEKEVERREKNKRDLESLGQILNTLQVGLENNM